MRSIAIIPARGGSVRIPQKNIRRFHGKAMIAYPIELALESQLFDAVVVSTDDPDIAAVAVTHGASVLVRPDELADAVTGTQAVTRHALLFHTEYQQACCIYPCSPMLVVQDLIRGWQAIRAKGITYAFSVGLDPLRDAGNFYWGWRRAFIEGVPVHGQHSTMIPLPADRVCDINTEHDWSEALRMYQALQERYITERASE